MSNNQIAAHADITGFFTTHRCMCQQAKHGMSTALKLNTASTWLIQSNSPEHPHESICARSGVSSKNDIKCFIPGANHVVKDMVPYDPHTISILSQDTCQFPEGYPTTKSQKQPKKMETSKLGSLLKPKSPKILRCFAGIFFSWNDRFVTSISTHQTLEPSLSMGFLLKKLPKKNISLDIQTLAEVWYLDPKIYLKHRTTGGIHLDVYGFISRF